MEDGNWILTMGAVNGDDLRRIGARTGVKTFMEIDFTYSPGPNVVWMSAVVYRAADGAVVWSDAYRSDATMTALLRTGRHIPTRAERARNSRQLESLFDVPVLLVSAQRGEGLDQLWKTIANLPSRTAA